MKIKELMYLICNKFFLLILLCLCICQADDKLIGFHWYNDEILLNNSEKNNKEELISFSDQLKKYQQLLNEAQAAAVLYPTELNIKNYIILQNIAANNASYFSSLWQKVLLNNPDINYQINHPTQAMAQSLMTERHEQDQKKAIALIAEKYGIFFFYRGKESLDQMLSKTLKSIADQYHLTVLGISIDGVMLSDFNINRADSGQATMLKVNYFPAILLIDPLSGVSQPLAYGFIAEDELKRRFLDFLNNFKSRV